ncbi:MAG: F0F1 ATP synthase subunit epsilon, partial [Planctomycetaceae bacterium]|nr:F0F1 ATP synthase subunit epsilon [Planctomycetaceae bacterium]
LGFGELQLAEPSGARESWFIDSGFVQVKGAQVSVLTNSAVAVSSLSRAAAEKELEAAREMKATSDEEFATLAKKLERARRMMSLAEAE